MSPDPDQAMPKVKSVGSGLVEWGIPLAAGVAGFAIGDVFHVDEVVYNFAPDFWGQLPLGNQIYYTRLVDAGIYGIGVAVVTYIHTRVGMGTFRNIVFKGLKWFLVGVAVRLGLSSLAALKIPAEGMIALTPGGA